MKDTYSSEPLMETKFYDPGKVFPVVPNIRDNPAAVVSSSQREFSAHTWRLPMTGDAAPLAGTTGRP